MPLPKRITLEPRLFYVDKTGIPFFDAARLIGVAHLFFGTASAEIEDKGAWWEVRGMEVKRDENQVFWAVEQLKPTKTERSLFYKNGVGPFLWDDLISFFKRKDLENRKGRQAETKAEYDVSLQIGTRGVDPLSKYEILAPRSTGETKKKFKTHFQQITAATLGRAFAARVIGRTKRQIEEVYILPVFRERFVLSGFLEYEKEFRHSAGGFVASVWAALSILLDLMARRLPVVDFAYTREVKGPTRQPIFSDSGYLGFERLCTLWQEGVKEDQRERINALRQIRSFLLETRNGNTDKQVKEQVQDLARWVAAFAANPSVEALTMIQRLKGRIQATVQNAQKSIQEAYATYRLFNRPEIIREVGAMTVTNLPTVPRQVTEALAHTLSLDEKGWMNQFTRLENATSFPIFITQVEHIISRGFYREQQENKKNIQEAMKKARDLSTQLRELASQLNDAKIFRAFKAVFLLDVLSRMRRPFREGPEI